MANCPEDAAVAVCPRWHHWFEGLRGAGAHRAECQDHVASPEPSSRKRTFWCEVRLKESKDHERAGVKLQSVVPKTAAQQLKDELVANSCAQGIMAIRATVHVSCCLSKEKRVVLCLAS